MLDNLRSSLARTPRLLLVGIAVGLVFLLLPLVAGRPPHHGPPAVLTSVSTSELGLATRDGWTKTVRLSEKTRIHQGPKPLTVADLKTGMHVLVRDEPATDGQRMALDVDVHQPPPPGRGPRDTVLALVGFAAVVWLSRRARKP